MPFAKTIAYRRPGDAPQPDPLVKRIAIAIAISVGQAANDADPWKNPKAGIKPNPDLDAWLDLEPKSEAQPQAQPKTQPQAEPVANSDVESLPDIDHRGVAHCLAEHSPHRGRHRHDYGHQLHAQQVGNHHLLQGQHSVLDQDGDRCVQRQLLNHGYNS
jgi:hypothetical protein